MAESYDAEEIEEYHWWVNSQQDPKKWKWATIDKAGTVNVTVGGKMVEKGVSQPLAHLMARSRTFKGTRHGKVEEYARATGRKIFLKNPDNFIYDENGVVTDLSKIPKSALIVDIDYDGNRI